MGGGEGVRGLYISFAFDHFPAFSGSFRSFRECRRPGNDQKQKSYKDPSRPPQPPRPPLSGPRPFPGQPNPTPGPQAAHAAPRAPSSLSQVRVLVLAVDAAQGVGDLAQGHVGAHGVEDGGDEVAVLASGGG